MRTWVVSYRDAEFKRKLAIVTAETYTMALLQFMRDYPKCEYTNITEVRNNESNRAKG